MTIELKVPELGESITEVEIGGWLKNPGEPVRKDEPLVTLETEKATLELPSPENGVMGKRLKEKGTAANVGEVIAYLDAVPPGPTTAALPKKDAGSAPSAPQSPPRAPETRVMPAAQAALDQHGLRPEQIRGTGPGGRILKEDVLRDAAQTQATLSAAPPKERLSEAPAPRVAALSAGASREEEVVPMSRLRRTVAERLVEAQHTAALLTTFNEIDMAPVMALRKQHGEAFQNRYQVKLGFMSFFVKACVDALKLFPALNAEVRTPNIVYHNYYDIGVAVGGGKGLVVPVLRNAERMSFAEIEVTIGDLVRRARENKLKIEELQGGTFTISNGGVYGSLLSTPIVNPPQSGVLGLHAIQERPVVRDGNVVVRPMMYIALTYDHRLVDGREAVSCLKRIKDVIEDPARMLMEI
jgi:2-oxoglutarate dehydrogenase E2 component (dihydrolipoamide succinyltransferase)